MSAARWLREFGGLGLSFFGSLLGWLLLAPAATLIPKRRDWIAVIGRQHGKFLDNAKHFFLQSGLHAPDLRLVFITERLDVIDLFAGSSREVSHYPGLRAVWYLLRCGTVVADSTDWGRHLRRFLLIRAHVLQLWHGVGFKRIELDKWRNETGSYRWFSQPRVFWLRVLFYRFTGRMVRYGAVSTTSHFYRDQVFMPAFVSDHFPLTGYPRNAFNTFPADTDSLLWSNVDAETARQLGAWTQQGRKLVIVAPTMRDSGAVPMKLDDTTVQAIDVFAETHGFEFLFKFHPSEPCADSITGRHLHRCSADSDIYPLLPQADALITDYSSIYMDYLLLDRPVFFLIPDGDNYAREDRQLQFDPADMMPGPITDSWEALLAVLANRAARDSYADARMRLRSKAFDALPQEQAVPKLIEFMREQHWLPVTAADQARP